MYFLAIAFLMLIGPLVSIAVEAALLHTPLTLWMAARWFVFWIVGLRLGLAGLRQMTKPEFTARVILGLKGDDVLLLVRELGIANTAFGIIGLLSFWKTGWIAAAAVAGAVFLGLAGVNHAFQPHRNPRENFAMATDLLGAVLLVACAWATW